MHTVTNGDQWEQAVERVRARRRLQLHVLVGGVSLALLALVWAVSEYQNAGGWPTGFATGRRHRDWDPWIVYPAVVWLSSVISHWAWSAWRRPVTEMEIRRELERAG